MNKHQKAYDTLNAAVQSLAISEGELQRQLLYACRTLSELSQPDFCEGLYINFQNLSKKLGIESFEFDEIIKGLTDKETEKQIKEICNLQLRVCEEYFIPGSY